MTQEDRDRLAIDDWISSVESDCFNAGQFVRDSNKLALRQGAQWGIRQGRASTIPWRDPRVERPDGRPVWVLRKSWRAIELYHGYADDYIDHWAKNDCRYCYLEEFPMPKVEGENG